MTEVNLTCPQCGKAVEGPRSPFGYFWEVGCNDCYDYCTVEGGNGFYVAEETKDRAIAAWKEFCDEFEGGQDD